MLLAGCGGPKRSPIVVPEISPDFYDRALEEINEQIAKSPEDGKLVEQKLYYCERLEWPVSCYSALESYRSSRGMSYQLVERYVAYYQKHESYELLLALIDQWNEKFKLEEKFIRIYIESLAKLGRSKEAVIELREFLKTNKSEEDIAFAARQYLMIGNRPLAILMLSRLVSIDSAHPLAWNYGKLLLEMGEENKGLEVLYSFTGSEQSSEGQRIMFARLLQQRGLYRDARMILDRYTNRRDSLALFYAELFEAEGRLDSAVYILEAFIAYDSTQREPYRRLGLLNERRGWLATAAQYFAILKERDPADTLAYQKYEEVQRKIAYLQRQEREAQELPLLILKPKKIENE